MTVDERWRDYHGKDHEPRDQRLKRALLLAIEAQKQLDAHNAAMREREAKSDVFGRVKK